MQPLKKSRNHTLQKPNTFLKFGPNFEAYVSLPCFTAYCQTKPAAEAWSKKTMLLNAIFVKVLTWICQSCCMDAYKVELSTSCEFLHGFVKVVKYISCRLLNFDQDFKVW